MPDSNGPSRELLVYFQEHHDDALALLRWLVEQESMSRVPDATAKIAEGLGAKLEEVGAKVELLRDPAFGASILARFHPREPPEDSKQLLVIGHIDTVWPIGTLSKRPFRTEGDRAYGPGTFDMKAGLTIASFAMRALRDLGRQPKRPVTFLFTCDEETGSHFSRDTIEREGRKSLSALVLEPPIPGGRVKTGRKGVGEFELVTYGRSAHAGNDPRAGINAITELAHQVLAINAMNDYERGTTLNVGVVSGGVLSNVVAAEARARIDMRYKTAEEGLRITEALSKLKPVVDGARLEMLGGINRPPLVRTPEIAALFEQARQIGWEIGYDLGEGSVGGGSDGNFVAGLGVPVLDGLGVDGAGAHAEHEHIVISDVPRRAALLARLIETI